MSIRKGGLREKDEPIFVLICESDVDDPFRSHGAIIFEQYTMDSEEEVKARAKSLQEGGKYGRVWIGRVEVELEVVGDDVVREVKRLTDVAHELGRRAAIHPNDVAAMIKVK